MATSKTPAKPKLKTKNFKYKGYSIPSRLVDLTGGGAETWDDIALYHMKAYEKYTPIKPNFTILEVGCGVGRDAIHLADTLSSEGRYIGFDIIEPSIKWCTDNITANHPNFEFHYFDIDSQIHNPAGKLKPTEIKLPAKDNSVDLIILQSVFTHMFSWDIAHYLKEFKRVLKPTGKVHGSWFILDQDAFKYIKKTKSKLSFKHELEPGCYINDKNYPEGAIGYTPEKFNELLQIGGLELAQPIHKGFWSGRPGNFDGQDIVILQVPTSGLKLHHQVQRHLARFSK